MGQHAFHRGYSLKLAAFIALAGVALALSGCGKQEFSAVDSLASSDAPGTFVYPNKVDFLLAEDNSGSMNQILPQVTSNIPGFLTGIQNSGWDYHFATTPLITVQAMSQVVASRYEQNWYNDPQLQSQWLPLFPGATLAMADSVSSWVFRTPTNYSGFMTAGGNINTGFEPGLQTIRNTLFYQTPGTGFLRNDALLVVLVVGNGNDSSGENFCPRPIDSVPVPCGQDGTIGPSYQTCTRSSDGAQVPCDLSYYENELIWKKGDPNLVRFYSYVAAENSNNCQGSVARLGDRYMSAATALGGRSYDLCGGLSVSSVLTALQSQLQTQQGSYETAFLFIPEQPDTNSIVISKTTGMAIPHLSQFDNRCSEYAPPTTQTGFAYCGYGSYDVIDSPVHMNRRTGYAIQLFGAARLRGLEQPQITYLPFGARST